MTIINRCQLTATFISHPFLYAPMKNKAGWWLFIFLLTLIPVFAQSTPYHLKLLAVQETDEGYQGSGADLYLELKEGSGRVFLETTPVTKMDTQISTRFAKEIACNHFKLDCNKHDFIFTIKADSNIIGGPSAGAAIAALTTIAVLDLDYKQDVAITGTVNSGGIIGPVGGVKEKMQAAAESKLTKVLIASGSANYTLTENETINLIEYGKNNVSLEVIEVVDLDEILFHLTGVDLNHKEVVVIQDAGYQKIMAQLKDVLCARNDKIEMEIEERGIQVDKEVSEAAEKKRASSLNATLLGDYYSAASFCFGNNLQLKAYYYEQEELSEARYSTLFEIVARKTELLERQLNAEVIDTISDLQTLMIVRERVHDVKEQIQKFNETFSVSTPKEKAGLLAYAEERFFSALSWQQFFAMDGKKFVVDREQLKNSCQQKIAEAEERFQYVGLFLGELRILNVKEKIATAQKSLENTEYELCLIEAAQAKADSNAILSSLGLDEGNVAPYLESKRKAVERVISENSAEDIFPILGYSYYQYANSLRQTDPFTALVYFEYALEMSDLGIYFPTEESFLEKNDVLQWRKEWWYALGGVVAGVGIGFLLGMWKGRKRRRKR